MVCKENLWCRYVMRKSCRFEACCYGHFEDWAEGRVPTMQVLKAKDKRLILVKIQEGLNRAINSGIRFKVPVEKCMLELLDVLDGLCRRKNRKLSSAVRRMLAAVYPFLEESPTTRPSPSFFESPAVPTEDNLKTRCALHQTEEVDACQLETSSREPITPRTDGTSVPSTEYEMADSNSLHNVPSSVECEDSEDNSAALAGSYESEPCPTLEFVAMYYL